MKTMCPLDYHHNGFVPNHVYGYTLVVLAGTKEAKSVQEAKFAVGTSNVMYIYIHRHD